MRPQLQSVILLLLVYNVITFLPVVSAQNYQLRSPASAEGDRDKRALDLGTLVRNLLMKSAYASNTKAAVSRNLINLKTATTTTTTPRPTTRRRPLTTTLAPFFAKKSFLFPFDLSSFSGGFQPINKFNNVPGSGAGPGPLTVGPRGGYLNFDYDYGQPLPRRRRPPTTTTAAPTTTTTAAPPALPLKRRPFPQRPKFPNYDYYDDDYDYGEVEPTTPAPASSPPPTRSRQRRPQQNQATPLPPQRTGARQDRPFRLRNPAIYQYAQTNDFSTNNNGNGSNDAATVDNAAPTAANNNANPNANNQLTTNDDTSQDTNEGDNANEAAFDPSIPEDYNDSSDNSNPNTNGNGSNGNDISVNDVDNNDNDEPTGQDPLFDDNNNSAPPSNAPPAPPSAQQPNFAAQFINPRNFNRRGPAPPNYGAQFINSRNFNGRGQAPPLSPLIQPYGLPSDYQNFQYPSFSDYSTQYQQPQSSSPVGYSVRYY